MTKFKNMLGNWEGHYTYSKLISYLLPKKLRGGTKFTIVITEFDNGNFSGTVEDDIKTGGMAGIGEINGQIIDSKISFTKQMPFKTIALTKKVVVLKKMKHPKIYYTGIFNDKSSIISGRWKLISLFIFKQTGKWEMKKI